MAVQRKLNKIKMAKNNLFLRFMIIVVQVGPLDIPQAVDMSAIFF